MKHYTSLFLRGQCNMTHILKTHLWLYLCVHCSRIDGLIIVLISYNAISPAALTLRAAFFIINVIR